ncbi:signal peptidase I [Patescibacteria group bacterium]|nr:signal peptidase I [Patescibacteria group bacterium]MBU1885758.1 signal peptidase I [Patescibacteria group bacterium]
MKKLGKFISNAVLILGILIATLLLIPLIPVVDQWYQLAIVKSASMEPRLSVGSLAVYKAQSAYYPGEVIAYQQGDGDEAKLVIHRVVEKKTQNKQTVYLTQGDANQYLSPQPVFAGQVRGKLLGSVSQAGYTLSWFKSKTGIATMIFIPLALLVISELTKLP